MELGKHQCKAIGHEIIENTVTGSLGILIAVQFDNGECDRAYVNLVKKDGSGNEPGIKQVRTMFGWKDDSIESLAALKYDPFAVEVLVVMDSGRDGFRPKPKIEKINLPGTTADVKALAAKFGSVFKTGATELAAKRLSDTPPPAAPVKDAVAKGEKTAAAKKPNPGAITFDAFKMAFEGFSDDEIVTNWHDLLSEQLGDRFDTDKATRADWQKVFKAIPAFRASVKSAQPTEEVPF